MGKKLLRLAPAAAFAALLAFGALGGLSNAKSDVRADSSWPSIGASTNGADDSSWPVAPSGDGSGN
ncbi:hypothetical protein [Streptomyces sp. NPDC050738]|uniref:hypothetical protein n=1 Tax=Streptomyces sp. NPDC050738 TaxID=3154744 RepID=UPI00343EDF8C